MQWTWCGRGGAAARGRWGARAVGLGPSIDFFFDAGAWFPPFARTRAAPGRRQPPAHCSTGCGRARAGPVPAIQAGTMALLGAAAGEGVERVVRSLSQGRRRSVDLATVWLHYDCGIAACDAGSTDRGTGGGWGVDGASWPRRETARQLPRPRNSLLGGAPPPSMFSRWGHVTRLHNIIGWLFRPLCVTMAYGLRMSRLGASEGVLHRS